MWHNITIISQYHTIIALPFRTITQMCIYEIYNKIKKKIHREQEVDFYDTIIADRW